MNVNNRKLFANRDARRRLSEMGGIVASSPELLGAAQQFQVGGMASPYERAVERMYEMGNDELRAAGLPRFAGSAMGYLGSNRAMEMLQTIDPNIGRAEFEAMSPQERADAGFSGQGLINRQYFDIRDSLMESQFPMQGPEMPVAERAPLSAEQYVNPVDEFPSSMGDSFRLPEMTIEQPARERTPAEVAGGDPASMEVFPADEAVVQRSGEPVVEESAPTEEPAPTEEAPADVSAEEIAAAVEGSDDPSAAAADTVLQRLGGFQPAGSVEERINQYEELFGRMFGEDEEAKRKEKYMNLAMIGFAIAAGEDPSALKNIADGLLQGSAQMREDAATRRQREDRIQELAVAAGLEDERLAQRLASESRFSPTEPFVDAVRTLAQSSLDQGLYTDIETALTAARRALGPYYGIEVNDTGTIDPAQALAEARVALEANPDNRAEIERRLEAVGIDPGDL